MASSLFTFLASKGVSSNVSWASKTAAVNFVEIWKDFKRENKYVTSVDYSLMVSTALKYNGFEDAKMIRKEIEDTWIENQKFDVMSHFTRFHLLKGEATLAENIVKEQLQQDDLKDGIFVSSVVTSLMRNYPDEAFTLWLFIVKNRKIVSNESDFYLSRLACFVLKSKFKNLCSQNVLSDNVLKNQHLFNSLIPFLNAIGQLHLTTTLESILDPFWRLLLKDGYLDLSSMISNSINILPSFEISILFLKQIFVKTRGVNIVSSDLDIFIARFARSCSSMHLQNWISGNHIMQFDSIVYTVLHNSKSNAEIYNLLEKLHNLKLAPLSIVCYARVIDKFVRRGDLSLAHDSLNLFLNYIKNESNITLENKHITVAAFPLIKHYSFSENPKLSRLLKDLQNISVELRDIDWFIIGLGLVKNFEWKKAVKLLFALENQGLQPKLEMYTCLLNSLIRRSAWLELLVSSPILKTSSNVRTPSDNCYKISSLKVEPSRFELLEMAKEVYVHLKEMNYTDIGKILMENGIITLDLVVKTDVNTNEILVIEEIVNLEDGDLDLEDTEEYNKSL